MTNIIVKRDLNTKGLSMFLKKHAAKAIYRGELYL